MSRHMVCLAKRTVSTKFEKLTILANSPHLAEAVSSNNTIFVFSGPLAFVQYNLVSEDDNIEVSIGLQTGQDISACFTSCLDIEGADADSSNRLSFGCHPRQSIFPLDDIWGDWWQTYIAHCY